MRKFSNIFEFIPYKCDCKCNGIVPLEKRKVIMYEQKGYPKFIKGHYMKMNNPSKNLETKNFEKIYGRFPPIFDLCWCGCNEIVYGGKRYKTHHNIKVKHPSKGLHITKQHKEKLKIIHTKLFLLRSDGSKEIYPKIPVICGCPDINCHEICWNGSEFKPGHQSKIFITLLDGTFYPSIPDICHCKNYCGTIVYNGNYFLDGHVGGWNKGLPEEMQPSYGSIKTYEARKKISDKQKRELNHNWKGGYSIGDYPQEFNDKLKESIRIRDSHICQNCGKTQELQLKEINMILSIHHIDYNKKNNDTDNLITLCLSCYARTSSNRRYYKEYFILFMEEYLCQK